MKETETRTSRGHNFSIAERHLIIQDYLDSGLQKREIWEKYTGEAEEHGQLIRWMRQLGYSSAEKLRRPNIVQQTIPMAKKQLSATDLEKHQLQQRIEALERQLKDAELKAIAFSTMVDIAEKELKMPIRKKYNTKP
jgi:hypothetical protein